MNECAHSDWVCIFSADIMKKLDQLMNESKSSAAAVKGKLKDIDEENKAMEPGSSLQMRLNMQQTFTKQFADSTWIGLCLCCWGRLCYVRVFYVLRLRCFV